MLRENTLGMLRPYQLLGATWLAHEMSRRRYLGDQMGLGKTLQTIVATETFEGRDPHTICLVVSPNMARVVWEEELKKWTTSEVVTLEGGSSDRVSQLDQLHYRIQWTRYQRGRLSRELGDMTYVLVNYESMLRIKDSLRAIPWDVIIFDEAHRLKNRSSKTFKAAKAITSNALTRVIMLSGTAITNQGDDIWAQMHVLDRKKWSSYWDFVERFCKTYFNGFGTAIDGVRPEMLESLHRHLAPYYFRRELRDHVDLPERIETDVWLDLDSKSQRLYDQMRDDLVADLDPEISLFAPHNLAKMTRLRQIAVSTSLALQSALDQVSPDTVLDEPILIEGPKYDALKEIIEESDGDQILVFSNFATAIQQTNIRLSKEGYSCAAITGSVDESDRRSILQAFKNGEIQTLLITIDIGGVALTLTNAAIVVQLNEDWSPAKNEQAIGRVDRIGQVKTVRVYRLLYRKTIDEAVRKSNISKSEDASAILTIDDIFYQGDRE